MTGRLASAFIAEAGKPQKIFTVPEGKTLEGHITAYNSTSEAHTIQIKRGNSIVAPAASFAWSNAEEQESTTGKALGDVIAQVGDKYLAYDGATPKLFDLTDQLGPQVVQAINGAPNSVINWQGADDLVMLATSGGDILRRYAGVNNPFEPGASFGYMDGGTIMGGARTVAGWKNFALGFRGANDDVSFTNSLGTSGSSAWTNVTFTSKGAGQVYGSGTYWAEGRMGVFAANGKFFMFFADTNGYQYRKTVIVDTENITSNAGWHFNVGSLYTNDSQIDGVFYANGRYFCFYKYSNNLAIKALDEADLFTAGAWGSTTLAVSDSGLNSYQNGSCYQLADGRVTFNSNGKIRVFDPQTDTVTNYVPDVANVSVPQNYADFHDGKLTPVQTGQV
ncbi:hypothetical protein, partial [uncultured Maritalea sp.]|uniref:hypothetical protein n=1 Tax=uncultured Maritalea sp. TaxID=757249 RepID=UPI0026063909